MCVFLLGVFCCVVVGVLLVLGCSVWKGGGVRWLGLGVWQWCSNHVVVLSIVLPCGVPCRVWWCECVWGWFSGVPLCLPYPGIGVGWGYRGWWGGMVSEGRVCKASPSRLRVGIPLSFARWPC